MLSLISLLHSNFTFPIIKISRHQHAPNIDRDCLSFSYATFSSLLILVTHDNLFRMSYYLQLLESVRVIILADSDTARALSIKYLVFAWLNRYSFYYDLLFVNAHLLCKTKQKCIYIYNNYLHTILSFNHVL